MRRVLFLLSNICQTIKFNHKTCFCIRKTKNNNNQYKSNQNKTLEFNLLNWQITCANKQAYIELNKLIIVKIYEANKNWIC